MTPQSSFTIVSPILPDRVDGLRGLLASMNHRPGVANPQNDLVPFGRLDRLHFARLVILDDKTRSDIEVYGLPPADFGLSLAFLADFDGPAGEFLADMVRLSGDGLRRIFAHCEGFHPDTDLLRWMRDRDHSPAGAYVNWLGRTARQIREEAALRDALVTRLREEASAAAGGDPQRVRDDLVRFAREEVEAGRLTLTAPEPTPLPWRLRNLSHAIGVPFLLLLLTPFLLLYLPLFLYQLRRRETRDPEIVPAPDSGLASRLADLEDHGVTNQFSALGTLKPGLFRRSTVVFFLWVLDYAARHIYNRGHLTRVSTIHFARWVFLDGKKRLLFASNYDGSLESYMDDFINKVGWGLNLVFSNGVGYPRTDWLVLAGAKDEQKFKRFIRRHELPTEVWYNPHPGLTAIDLDRNTRIRRGLEQPAPAQAEIREWLGLLC